MLNKAEHFLDGWALPDDATKAPVGDQLTFERRHFASRIMTLYHFAQQHSQTLWVDRLGNVVVSAVFHRVDRTLDTALSGHHDERHVVEPVS